MSCATQTGITPLTGPTHCTMLQQFHVNVIFIYFGYFSLLSLIFGMGEVQEQSTEPTNIMVREAKAETSPENENTNYKIQSSLPRQYSWWFQMVIFTVFVLAGQSVATILGRLYYNEGGSSKWMATFVQNAGFPILVPFLFLTPNEKQTAENSNKKHPSLVVLVSLYLVLGIFLAADCMLYSIGLLYLPVSTYTLICASQLGFNAFFSYFFNSQKLTPYIINSLVLLTISSMLLVFAPDSSDSNIPKGKYAVGFICTVGASAGWSLMLSATQISFQKILKRESFRVVMDMIIYQSAVATCVIVIGLFASGEWKGLSKEMQEFKLGSVSYVMTLVWISLSWQVFSIGCVGLIFKISSLFSNVISTLGVPIIPVAAVFIFNEKMNGVKVVSMLLAIWGFVSYIYQHYVDDLEAKARTTNANQVSEVPLIERC